MSAGPSSVHTLPLAANYASERLLLERGRGVYLFDAAGKRYLDFGAGIAVNALGYGRRDLAAIAGREMRLRTHVSNLYITSPALRCGAAILEDARRLNPDFGAVYFGNSGSEANEAALKFARLYARETKGAGHHRLISFHNAFHGRTMGALSMTPTPAYREKFEPLIPDVHYLPYNDIDALEKALTAEVAAVIVEPIQGEGGLATLTADCAVALNRLCRQHDILLIADEIQTGLGRVGALFASQTVGLMPDIVTLSKPLAGGLPLSATIIAERVNRLLRPGDHGSTFGGGPVTTAVAEHVWKLISDARFLVRVQARANHLRMRLEETAKRLATDRAGAGHIGDLCGAGMLLGLKITLPELYGHIVPIIQRAQQAGLLLLRSGSAVLRVAPPLIISDHQIDYGMEILYAVVRDELR